MIVVINLLVADDGNCTTFLKSLSGKLVAVKRFALQGDENAALRALAAVSGDDRMLLVDCVKFFAIHNDDLIFCHKITKITAFLCNFAPDF